jgi:hypothetical protein
MKIKSEAETMTDYKTRANLQIPAISKTCYSVYFHVHSEINLLGAGSQIDADNKIIPWYQSTSHERASMVTSSLLMVYQIC